MIELSKARVKVLAMAPKIGKRGSDKEPQRLVTLKCSMVASSEILVELHPTLRSFLYVEDDSPDMVGGDRVTKLRFGALLNSVALDSKIVGAEVSIEYGASSQVSFDLADVKMGALVPQEGGTVIVPFTVTGEQSGNAVGKVFDQFLGSEVEMTIKKPESPQQELEV